MNRLQSHSGGTEVLELGNVKRLTFFFWGNWFPHLATSTSTVVEKFKLFQPALVSVINWARATRIPRNYFNGNMTSQWTKQKSLEFVSEILWEAAVACVLIPFRREKARADVFLITASVSQLNIELRSVRDSIKYLLSLFSITSLVF